MKNSDVIKTVAWIEKKLMFTAHNNGISRH